MTELSTGADQNGYNPFVGTARFTGKDSYPGDISTWWPYTTDWQVVSQYGYQLQTFQHDTSQLNALKGAGRNPPGGRRV